MGVWRRRLTTGWAVVAVWYRRGDLCWLARGLYGLEFLFLPKHCSETRVPAFTATAVISALSWHLQQCVRCWAWSSAWRGLVQGVEVVLGYARLTPRFRVALSAEIPAEVVYSTEGFVCFGGIFLFVESALAVPYAISYTRRWLIL